MQMRRFSAVIALLLLASRSAEGCTAYHRQAAELAHLDQAIRMYAISYGRFPQTDEESTWFEKLADLEFIIDDDWETVSTPTGRLPLDINGMPLVFDVEGSRLPGDVALRSVGKNGVDDHGALDDWDVRTGPQLGYWYKRSWMQLYRRAAWSGLLLTFAIVSTIACIRSRHWRWILIAFEFGVLSTVVLPWGFSVWIWRSSASHMPDWPDWLASAGSLMLVLSLFAAFVKAGRPLLRLIRIPSGLCRVCGYDLRGTPSGRCPECGERNTPPPGGYSLSAGRDGG